MRTAQELIERWKKAQAGRLPTPVSAAYKLPGTKYRDERGRMVTLINRTQSRVTYRREGYQEICELSSSAFDRKFTEVKS